MTDEFFLVDSNILIYAFDSSEHAKHVIAKEFLTAVWQGKEKCALSIQNISEFFVNITKKIQKPISPKEARLIIIGIIESNNFKKITPRKGTLIRATEITITSNVSYWDALIAATMIENGIFHIYTENIKDFSKIQGIKAVNPFVKK